MYHTRITMQPTMPNACMVHLLFSGKCRKYFWKIFYTKFSYKCLFKRAARGSCIAVEVRHPAAHPQEVVTTKQTIKQFIMFTVLY
jgi:hypothetical protein